MWRQTIRTCSYLLQRCPRAERLATMLLVGAVLGGLTALVATTVHLGLKAVPSTAWAWFFRHDLSGGIRFGVFAAVVLNLWPRHVWRLVPVLAFAYFVHMAWGFRVADSYRDTPFSWTSKAYWYGIRALMVIPCCAAFAWLSTRIDFGLKPEEIAERQAARAARPDRVRRAGEAHRAGPPGD